MAKTNAIVEVYYDGDWHQIPVYTRDPIEITRGQEDELSRPGPSTCTLSIDNRTGAYSPRNPRSALYGKLGRNTPLRVRVGSDIRFTGEVEAWPVRWSVDGNDVWAPVTAHGIMRRLLAPGTDRPAHTPLHRAIAHSPVRPLDWWPLDEPAGSTLFESAAGGEPVRVSPTTRPGAAPELYGGSAVLAYGPNDLTGESQDILLVPKPHSAFQQYVFQFWFAFLPELKDDSAPWPDNTNRVDPDIEIDPGTPADSIWFSSVMHQVRLFNAFVNISMRTGDQESDPDEILINMVDLPAQTNIDSFTFRLPGHEIRTGWHEIRVELEQSGADVLISVYVDGVQVESTETATLQALGIVERVRIGRVASWFDPLIPAPTNQWMPYGVAHFQIYTDLAAPSHYTAALGHIGETAAERIERLCDEEGVPITIIGDPDLSEPLGAQRTAPFLDLVFDAVDADGGILYEPRDSLGLAYRTRSSLYTQDAAVTLDYAAGGEVSPPLDPVEDTDHLTNDVTVRNETGGSARAVRETGPLNVQEPPDGVGRYRSEITLSLAGPGQCAPIAAWLVHTGTWDEPRFPVLNMDLTAMAADGKATLAAEAAALDVGQRLVITNPPDWLPPEDIDQLARGFAETIGSHRHTIAVNATPAGPFRIATVEHPLYSIVGSDGSTVAAPFVAGTDTSLSVAVAAGYPLWEHEDDFDVFVAGVRLTVTAISGASSPQTFTVNATPVNGITRTIDVGETVDVFHGSYIGK